MIKVSAQHSTALFSLLICRSLPSRETRGTLSQLRDAGGNVAVTFTVTCITCTRLPSDHISRLNARLTVTRVAADVS